MIAPAVHCDMKDTASPVFIRGGDIYTFFGQVHFNGFRYGVYISRVFNSQPITRADQWRIQISSPGSYSVEVMNADGCTALSSEIFVKQRIRFHPHIYSTERTITGSEPEVSIYPNPAQEIFTVNVVNAGESEVIISVYDITGRILHTEAVQPVSGMLSAQCIIDKAATGVYTVLLTGRDYSLSIPLLISH